MGKTEAKQQVLAKNWKSTMKNWKKVLKYSPTVKEIYETRWVWYHTILAVELFLVIVLLMLILFKL